MVKKMNTIEKLINDLCPDGVNFLLVDSVITSLRTGLNPRQNFKLNPPDAKNHYVTVRELGGFDIRISDKTDRVDDAGLALIQNRSNLRVGDILFSGTGTIGRTALVSGKPSDWNIKEGIYALTPKHDTVNPRYLIYLLHSETVRRQIFAKADGSTVSSIPMAMLRKVKIPIPPLDVQEEIVKILDNFTMLEAELEAELEARRKQYDYYRDELLNVREHKELEFKELGEALKRTKGTPITAGQMSKLNKKDAPIKIFAGGRTVAYVDYGDIPDKDVLTKKSVVVKSRGIIAFEYIDKPFSHKNEFWSYHSDNPEISIKYIYYYLKSKEAYFQTIGQRMSKMPQLSIPDTDNFEIPIPPRVEQDRIVAILDKFDALVNDISIGLPAELNARRKQYEYYRDQLLTFKPLEMQNAN